MDTRQIIVCKQTGLAYRRISDTECEMRLFSELSSNVWKRRGDIVENTATGMVFHIVRVIENYGPNKGKQYELVDRRIMDDNYYVFDGTERKRAHIVNYKKPYPVSPVNKYQGRILGKKLSSACLDAEPAYIKEAILRQRQ